MRIFVFTALIFVASCGQSSDPTIAAQTDVASTAACGPSESAPATGPALAASAPLAARLDCLRESGGALVIAHRGGPTREFPENAIETLERTLKAGTRVMEVDIATSKDGVLFLMHDDTLDRTTTGEGEISALGWEAIRDVNLETYSEETGFKPPTLKQALEWAVANGVILELDRKRTTDAAAMVAAVRAAKAENNVLMITYTDEQAAEMHRLAPELVINATIDSTARLDRLIAAGVRPEHLLAWTGVEAPNPELWQALSARGIESIFGTQSGARGEKLDDIYWEDRNASEYRQLAADGLTLVVTGVSDRVTREMAGELDKAIACGF